jgi:hypothetical protein
MYHERLEGWILEQAGIEWKPEQTVKTPTDVQISASMREEVRTPRTRPSMAEAFARSEPVAPPDARGPSANVREDASETKHKSRPIKMSEVFASVIENAIHRSPAQLADASDAGPIAVRTR